MGTILIAEDNKEISKGLKLYLQAEGYTVYIGDNGAKALKIFNTEKIDLGIFDIMMPEMDGYDLITKIRKTSDMPIFILSAKNHDNDKILGLNIGADDYITKPFNPLEVVARVKAAFRRITKTENVKKHLIYDNINLDCINYKVYKDDELLDLTITEFKTLKLLMARPGQIFSKVRISEYLNGEYFESDENTITVHISRIRSKLGKNPMGKDYITTVRGLGYKIEKK